MNRRAFIKQAAILSFIGINNKSVFPKSECNISAITKGPKHHFFGYYGICPWNKSQTYILGLETDFQDHMPVYIYNMTKNKLQKIVDFNMKKKQNIQGNLRCDFHPRWNHNGDAICFDGIDQKDGTRQLHIVNLDEQKIN